MDGTETIGLLFVITVAVIIGYWIWTPRACDKWGREKEEEKYRWKDGLLPTGSVKEQGNE